MKRNNENSIKPYISKRIKKNEVTSNQEEASETFSLSTYGTGTAASYFKIPRTITDKSNKHTNVISTLSWHPTKRNLLLSSSYDKTISLWNVQNSKLIHCISKCFHDEAIKCSSWSNDGTNIFTASYDKMAKLYDVDKGIVKRAFTHDDHVTAIHAHPDQENIFITGTNSNGILSWDVRQEKYIRKYGSHIGVIEDLLFLPDNKTFVASAQFTRKNSLDKSLSVFDFDSTVVLSDHIYQEPHTCSQLKLNPNRKTFLANFSAGYIAIFDCQSPWKLNKYKRYEGHQCGGYSIGFDISHCGTFLYCGDSNGLVYCYNGYTSHVKHKLAVFDVATVRVAKNRFHPSLLVCGSWNGGIALLE